MARVYITGHDKLKGQLKGLRESAPDVMLGFVTEFTLDVHQRVIRGMRTTGTGRTYRRRGVSHTASAPGEYPAVDTGRLVAGIEFELPTNDRNPEGIVGTNVLYGKYLEFKPPNMGGRPWLSRALNEAARGGEAMLAKAWKRRNRGGK